MMQVFGERLCPKCGGTGQWVNPNYAADKRECFACSGTGRATRGEAPKVIQGRARRRAAPAEDFFAPAEIGGQILAGPSGRSGGDSAEASPPAALDVADLTRTLTARLTPLIRNEVADATGHAERELRRVIETEVTEAVEVIADEVESRLQRRLPQRIELSRNGVVLPPPTGHQHPKFATLLRLATARNVEGVVPNIWITGPAGSGKTTGARQLAAALGVPFFYNGALSTEFQVLGHTDAAGHYHTTAFRQAMEQPSVYLFDDIDSCDSNAPLLALNGALANGLIAFPDRQLERHPDSVVLATANTWGYGATSDYVGRVKIDAAFLNRFGAKVDWGYDEPFEAAIGGNAEWAKRVQRARAKAAAAALKVVISPRASIAGAAYLAAGFAEDEVAELTYLAGLNPDQRHMLGSGA